MWSYLSYVMHLPGAFLGARYATTIHAYLLQCCPLAMQTKYKESVKPFLDSNPLLPEQRFIQCIGMGLGFYVSIHLAIVWWGLFLPSTAFTLTRDYPQYFVKKKSTYFSFR